MRYKFLLLTILFAYNAVGQDTTLLSMLNDSLKAPAGEQVMATFKASRIINMQTVQTPAKGDLNFIIMHRFGKLNDGSYNFFGLDNATLRMGLDYGISNRLGIGI